MYSHGSWILHSCDGSHENNYFPNYTTLDPWDLALELILDVMLGRGKGPKSLSSNGRVVKYGHGDSQSIDKKFAPSLLELELDTNTQ